MGKGEVEGEGAGERKEDSEERVYVYVLITHILDSPTKNKQKKTYIVQQYSDSFHAK